MKITADTNVLVRAITGDDERQSKIAQAELAKADLVSLAFADTFISFDKKAVKLMEAQGESIRLLSWTYSSAETALTIYISSTLGGVQRAVGVADQIVEIER